MKVATILLCLFSLLLFGANQNPGTSVSGKGSDLHRSMLTQKTKALVAAQEYADLEENLLEEYHIDGPQPPTAPAFICDGNFFARNWFQNTTTLLFAAACEKADPNFPSVRIHHTPIYLSLRVLRI